MRFVNKCQMFDAFALYFTDTLSCAREIGGFVSLSEVKMSHHPFIHTSMACVHQYHGSMIHKG